MTLDISEASLPTRRKLNPRDHIDRKGEQELFRGVVTYQSRARILTICDQGGRGKSSLLKRLVYNCGGGIRPPIPSCFIELDKLSDRDPSPFGVALAMVAGFVVPGEKVAKRFAKFNGLDAARIAKDFTPFDDGGGTGRSRGPRMLAVARAGTNYGENIGMKIEHAERVEVANPDFTDAQEQRARERCVEALFDDLRTICATHPMVLLLDAWE